MGWAAGKGMDSTHSLYNSKLGVQKASGQHDFPPLQSSSKDSAARDSIRTLSISMQQCPAVSPVLLACAALGPHTRQAYCSAAAQQHMQLHPSPYFHLSHLHRCCCSCCACRSVVAPPLAPALVVLRVRPTRLQGLCQSTPTPTTIPS
jgi:hypothetical protein